MRLVLAAAASGVLLRRITPMVPELAWAGHGVGGEEFQSENVTLDERCHFKYPDCAPTCVNRYSPRNNTIYDFEWKGCYLTVDTCRVHTCFESPQLFPDALQPVDCPVTVCEFAAGLERPSFDPRNQTEVDYDARTLDDEGNEIVVPAHERYAAGRACFPGSWALRQTPDREALHKRCDDQNETSCRESDECSWRADAPRWFHRLARGQPSAAVPYLTTDDKVVPPPAPVVESLYKDAGGEASGEGAQSSAGEQSSEGGGAA
jgi:hypothetical protein